MVFLSNWLVYKVVLAAVVADEEVVGYPLAGDFTLHFDGNDTLYFSGGSKEFASNVTIYQGSNTFAVNDTSDIFINKTGTYYAEMDVCGGRFKTNEVTVSSITDYKELTNAYSGIIEGYATAGDPAQGSMGSYIDFNADGTRMVVGMGQYNSVAGRAAVYHLENGSWVQKVDLAPPDSSSRFGDSVCMNDAGTRIAVNHYPASKIYIYDYSGTAWPTTAT